VPLGRWGIDERQAAITRQALAQAERQHVRVPAKLLAAFAVFSFNSPTGTRTPDGYLISHPALTQRARPGPAMSKRRNFRSRRVGGVDPAHGVTARLERTEQLRTESRESRGIGKAGACPSEPRNLLVATEGVCSSGCSEVAAERFADQRGRGGSLGLGAVEQLAPEFGVQPD
jgi:hypothetical protein